MPTLGIGETGSRHHPKPHSTSLLHQYRLGRQRIYGCSDRLYHWLMCWHIFVQRAKITTNCHIQKIILDGLSALHNATTSIYRRYNNIRRVGDASFLLFGVYLAPLSHHDKLHFGHVKRMRRGDNSNNELDDSRTLHRLLETTGVGGIFAVSEGRYRSIAANAHRYLILSILPAFGRKLGWDLEAMNVC